MPDQTCTDCAPPAALQASASRPSEPEITPVVATKAGVARPAATAASEPPAPAATQTFTPPSMLVPHVVIEFCDRCRCITLQPHNTPETGGVFRVWLDRGNGFDLVWDRKSEGGFPELKVLKQRVRNLVQPDMNLGHSDKPGKHGAGAGTQESAPGATA